jgi:predicted restriction endonuclease
MTEAARGLEIESRARILPEEELEATLIFGDERAVKELIQKEEAGISEKRRTYLYRQAPARNRKLVKELQRIYDGRCQLCLWQPKEIYGQTLCHAHHIQWLSRGGDDRMENMILLCPNHHSAIHKCDAPLDYGDLSFDFGHLNEKIRIRKHELLF